MAKPRSRYTADRKPAPLPVYAPTHEPPAFTAQGAPVSLDMVRFRHAVELPDGTWAATFDTKQRHGALVVRAGAVFVKMHGHDGTTMVPLSDVLSGRVAPESCTLVW